MAEYVPLKTPAVMYKTAQEAASDAPIDIWTPPSAPVWLHSKAFGELGLVLKIVTGDDIIIDYIDTTFFTVCAAGFAVVPTKDRATHELAFERIAARDILVGDVALYHNQVESYRSLCEDMRGIKQYYGKVVEVTPVDSGERISVMFSNCHESKFTIHTYALDEPMFKFKEVRLLPTPS